MKIFKLFSVILFLANAVVPISSYSSGRMNDEKYIAIYAHMMHYDRVYKRKYKIVNTDPNANRTAEGIANVFKYSDAMQKQRKALLIKYAVTAEDLKDTAPRLRKMLQLPRALNTGNIC